MDKKKMETMITAWKQEQLKAIDQVAYFKGAIEAAEHILATHEQGCEGCANEGCCRDKPEEMEEPKEDATTDE